VSENQQFVTPLVVDSLDGTGAIRSLKRIAFNGNESAGAKHDERWLQCLLYRYPSLLPVRELEPGFSSLVPVCIELPTPAGRADNLFVTGTGDIVLAECKLWRNPQARREVVAQVIDYAQAMAAWGYEDLEAAIRKGKTPDETQVATSLAALVAAGRELPETEFVDAVTRNLRLGRLLLLVVGDGIREGVESLAGYLQRHAGFHFTFGLIEMSVFQLPEPQGYLIQPRVLARTINIERAIVRVASESVAVEAVPSAGPTAVRRSSIGLERFLEALGAQGPSLQRFLDRAQEHSIDVDVIDGLNLKYRHGGTDRKFNLGTITKQAQLDTTAVGWKPNAIGQLALAHDYLEELARLVGGEVRQTPKPESRRVVVRGGTASPDIGLFLEKADGWLEIIDRYVERLSNAVETQENA